MRSVPPSLLTASLWPWLAFGQQAGAGAELQRALEEFKVQTRNLGLRGEGGGRVRQAAPAGGRWHGRLFENFRNDFLDAVPHEIRQRGGTKSLLRRNQFGFNLSGPVLLPRLYYGGRRTFFSVSYEGVRERISRAYLRTIAPIGERTGDFSATVDQAGEPLPIFDPATTRPNPSYNAAQPVTEENLEHLRAPFPGNRIPASRIDLVARKSLDYYPKPNAAVGPFFRNNYFVVSPETNSANGMIFKLDHSIEERHRVSFGTSFSNGYTGAAAYFPTPADPGPSDRRFSSRRGSLEHVFTASPRTLNTFTFEAVSDRSDSSRRGEGDYPAEIGFRGAGGRAFPVFRFSPYLSMGRSTPESRSVWNSFLVTDALATRRGKHSMRLLGQFVRYQVNAFQPGYPSASLRFGSQLTGLPGIVNTGHAFASFLLGLSDFGEASLVDSPSYFRRSSSLVALREQWEAAGGLTFSMGVNLETNTPRVEKYDRQSTVDLAAPNPVNGRPGALIFAGRNGAGRAFQSVQFRAEPSASIAWSPSGDPKTVMRLGYSRSYQPIPVYASQWATQGFTGSPAYISRNTHIQPAVTLSAGLPPPAFPLPDLRAEAANDTIADLMDRSSRQPRYQSLSVSLERELPAALVLTAGYGHSDGKNLLVSNGSANPNAIPLSALAYRDRLNDEDFNRSLRPYPQYKRFDIHRSWPLGRYQRDAGYARLEKRTSRGLSLSAYYEFSKQMDDYSGPHGTQDFYDRSKEWALTAYNNPHRISLTYAYELPLGPNKAFLGYSDWRRHLVEGWSVSGVTSYSSGEPLALEPQFNNTGGVLSALTVDWVPGVNPRLDRPSPELWFNPAAFDQPPDFAPGNGSRTHPTLRNPSRQNHDLSLTKRFALVSNRTLEFSAVGLNFVNHANWNDPDTTIGPASAPNVNAGKIIGSRGGRVVQLGVRFSF